MLAARILLLLAAGGFAVAGVLLTVHVAAPAGAAHSYVCPMHPQVTAAGPSQCPICRMELELVVSGAAKPITASTVRAEAHPAHAYACPMHPEIGGAEPGRCSICKMDLEPSGATAKARSAPDPKYAPGALWLPESFPREPPTTAQVVLAPAKPRAFVGNVRAPARVEGPERVVATLYRDEIVGMAPGDRGVFFRASRPRFPVPVRLSDDAPAPWDTSTTRVRFIVDHEPPKADADVPAPAASELALSGGEVGWLELRDRTRTLLSVPKSALLRSSAGPYVLVPNPDGHTYARRPLEIGRVLQGHAAVVGGLREGESIVVGGAFFLDAAMGHEPSADAVAGGPR